MAVSSKVVSQYSTAMFLAAKEEKKTDKVLKDLTVIREIFHKFSKELMLSNDPIYKDSVRLDLVNKVSKYCKFDKLTKNFLTILALKKRFNSIDGIVERYHELHCSMNNVEKIEVTSVASLTEGQIESIKDFFTKTFKKKIWIDNIIDPEIIGGIVIRVGSVVFDNSLLNKISRIKLSIEKEIDVEQ